MKFILTNKKYIELADGIVNAIALINFMENQDINSTLRIHSDSILYRELGDGLKSYWTNERTTLILHRSDIEAIEIFEEITNNTAREYLNKEILEIIQQHSWYMQPLESIGSIGMKVCLEHASFLGFNVVDRVNRLQQQWAHLEFKIESLAQWRESTRNWEWAVVPGNPEELIEQEINLLKLKLKIDKYQQEKLLNK